jgi:hypothetical protein
MAVNMHTVALGPEIAHVIDMLSGTKGSGDESPE